jgi:hypothetical protein
VAAAAAMDRELRGSGAGVDSVAALVDSATNSVAAEEMAERVVATAEA